MSKKLKLISGIDSYEIDNGTADGSVLKVNFSDTNLYFRFLDMEKSLGKMEKAFEERTDRLKEDADEDGKEMIALMHEFDVKIKDKLTEVFGRDNDFDNIFAGVNVMSLDEKGNSIIANFLEMIAPVIEKAMEVVKKSDDKAVQAIVGNREQRRARNGK